MHAIVSAKKRRRKGFTLLELLMVVLIVAILASIGFVSYIRSVERSRAAELLPVLAAVRSAQLRYRAQNDSWASNINQLDTEIPSAAEMKYWYWGSMITAGDGSYHMHRTDGMYRDQDVGINLATGEICSSFVPLDYPNC